MGFRAHRADKSRKSVAVMATALVLVSCLSSACNGSRQGEPPCFPPNYAVNPTVAKPGDAITVHAADAGCNPRYGQNARIQIIVTDAAGHVAISTTAPMNDAGGFSYQFDVPLQTAPGEASVEAYPLGVDWCDDTGTNNRVPHAEGFSRASCAARTKPLAISP